ncbi:NTP transferase domain-containing protein [Caulobacter sp. S45]|uniref:phosphocholine cytidylyltransferase family protein n=1 Tax=Caulobacter sp. S45 TaxID=1641861 RepID=UPI001576A171|nr:NTP transferase domain-containing protein [Caulobacter sp. S45]
MKALIVAAGQGVRLRGLAASKPLAPVGGVALIERVIAGAARAGVSEFVVVTGYQGDAVAARLADISARLDLTVTSVFNPDWRGANGVSVLAAEALLTGEFLLLMADHLFDPSILADLIALDDAAPVVLAVDRRLGNPLVDLEDVTRVQTAKGGAIRRIGKLIDSYDAFDTGLFRAGPALFDALRADVEGGGGGGISAGMQRLADAGRASTFDIGDRFWIDVDDALALDKAERSLRATSTAVRIAS